MQNSIITECWKPIVGFEGLYEASDLGNVRSLNYRNTGKTKVLRPRNCHGYYRVSLYGDGKSKHFLIQRLIYSAFKGPIPPGMHVDHVNNDKRDNRLENLQLLTPADNVRKAHLGKPSAMKGKTHSEAAKEKMRAAKKGKKVSADTRARMSAGQKARWQREKNAGKISH